MKYDWLLFDLDNTILDFDQAMVGVGMIWKKEKLRKVNCEHFAWNDF